MKEKPLVSIVITTYKRPPEIVMRAVKSAIAQTYSSIEIIVVDDSPAEYELRNTVKLEVESLNDPRVRLIWHEKNLGACAARNTAIRASHGEYIIYLDDDDEFLPEMIKERLKAFTKKEIGLVYSTRYLCYNNDKTKLIIPKQKLVSGQIFKYTIRDNNICAFPLIRRECFDTCGMFDEEQLSAQDYEMWLRILQKYEAAYVDKPLAIVHIHNTERITTTPIKAIQGTERICQIYKRYYHKHPYAYHFRKRDLCRRYYQANNIKQALKNWAQAVLLWPFDIVENLKLLKMICKKRDQ